MAEESNMEISANSISMVDVLEEENDLEEDARAVLGGSDAKNCTYSQGYVKRQALYSCLTCIPAETGNVGGVCLACSLSCHEGHTLIELYTRRNFRCDCGNSLYGGKKICSLDADKTSKNEQNVYNHNFAGKYCTCDRPYPDPEDSTNDEMIQCIMCEDWYHSKHLEGEVPDSDDYGEMVCQKCSAKYSFLKHYPLGQSANKDGMPVANDTGKVWISHASCKLQLLTPVATSGTLFLDDGWRQRLCRCEDCDAMYVLENITFLLDANDTVQSYEEMGKVLDAGGSSSSQYEQGMQALSQMDRVKQIEAIGAYNFMKQQLMAYLKSFADNKTVVQEEDIRKFFSDMEARKPPRDDPPPFCR